MTPIQHIKSNHWTEGGTGLTNFKPSNLPYYLKAIEEFGDPNFVVSKFPMNGLSVPGDYSLHRLDMQPAPKECEPFWKVFDRIKYNR